MLMQPDNPQPSTPYDFILDNNQSKKTGASPKGPSGQTMRLLIAAGGALILIVAIFVFLSILSNSGKQGTQSLIDIAETQTEIIRVAGIGVTKARITSVKNLAATTSLSMETSQLSTLNLLKKEGHPLSPKVLSLKKDTDTDARLTAADENNQFDDIFTKIIITSMSNYQAALKKAYDASSKKSEKTVLSNNFQVADLIIKSQTASN